MTVVLKILITITFAPIIGCILSGIERKISARLQSRVGPPLLQPLYDLLKLLSKENIIVTKGQNIYILLYFIFNVASLIMLMLGMDLLAILFVFTIANVALIVGAVSTGSPYSKIGSQREIMAMLAYEPILLFFIFGMYKLTGSFKVSDLLLASKPMILYMPLNFIAMLSIMSIKFKKSPFDFSASHHAHQELVRGIFTEYSGPAMALVEFTHWYEYVFLLGLMFIFWGQNLVIGIIISLITFVFIIILDNITARLTWQWMVKFTWSLVVGISILNILYLYLFNIKIV